MKIVFMGTPDFAVPILQSLALHHKIAAVLTQPDRPKGRSGKLQPPPVKILAKQLNIPVLQPEKIKSARTSPEQASPEQASPEQAGLIKHLRELQADVFVVVAYGQILPANILNIPPKGCINIHASLLPEYRGAAPIHRAILDGKTETGITIMYMDEGMDTGDMILKKTLPIAPADRYKTLHARMAALSCEAILEALTLIEQGTAQRVPQDHTAATYAPMLKKEEGLINWHDPTAKILCQIRALDPWPGTYTFYGGKQLKIRQAEPARQPEEPTPPDIAPGTVLEAGRQLTVKTADGALTITELQAQNSKRMPAEEFLRGKPLPPGTVLGA